MFADEQHAVASIRQNFAAFAVDRNLLAAERDKSSAAVRPADFDVEGRGGGHVGLIGQNQTRALPLEDDGANLIREKGFQFAVIFPGLGELRVADRGFVAAPEPDGISKDDADGGETDGPGKPEPEKRATAGARNVRDRGRRIEAGGDLVGKGVPIFGRAGGRLDGFEQAVEVGFGSLATSGLQGGQEFF